MSSRIFFVKKIFLIYFYFILHFRMTSNRRSVAILSWIPLLRIIQIHASSFPFSNIIIILCASETNKLFTDLEDFLKCWALFKKNLRKWTQLSEICPKTSLFWVVKEFSVQIWTFLISKSMYPYGALKIQTTIKIYFAIQTRSEKIN